MALIPAASNEVGLVVRKRKSEVLSEEEYTAKLESVIEQEYFPHLRKLQSLAAYLEEHERYDLAALRRTYRALFPNIKSVRMSSELVEPRSVEQEGERGGEGEAPRLTIAQFFNRYISEDNDSFLDLQEQSLAKHRQKYHWMYEALDNAMLLDGTANDSQSSAKKPGMLMLYYIGNKVLSADERTRMDRILNGEANVGDDRPSNLDSWAFRVRNQLMFYPELKDSLQICRVATEQSQPKLIADFAFQAPAPRTSTQKAIQRENIRAPGDDLVNQIDAYLRGHVAPRAIEQPHTPTTVASSEEDFAEGGRTYREVSMTPLAVPGRGVLASPLMTWGQVAATPMVLEGSATPSRAFSNMQTYPAPGRASLPSSSVADWADGTPHFTIQAPSRRERLARDIEDKRKRRASTGSITGASSVKPLSSQHRRLASLSPAAQGLAQRLLRTNQPPSL